MVSTFIHHCAHHTPSVHLPMGVFLHRHSLKTIHLSSPELFVVSDPVKKKPKRQKKTAPPLLTKVSPLPK